LALCKLFHVTVDLQRCAFIGNEVGGEIGEQVSGSIVGELASGADDTCVAGEVALGADGIAASGVELGRIHHCAFALDVERTGAVTPLAGNAALFEGWIAIAVLGAGRHCVWLAWQKRQDGSTARSHLLARSCS